MFIVIALHNLSETEQDDKRLVTSPILFTTSDRKAFKTATGVEALGFKFVSRGARVVVYYLKPGKTYRLEHFASTDLSHQNRPDCPLVFEIEWKDGIRRPVWGNIRYLKNIGPGRRKR
jgi:hypothetical protein